MGEEFSGSSTAIDSSNIGFKLLKKHGWKEGTGLGVCEQGRLEPIRTCLKNNKRGLGAEKNKYLKEIQGIQKMRKMQELEKQLQETELSGPFVGSSGQIMFEMTIASSFSTHSRFVSKMVV
ncbi:hypothetical protein LWI28_008451 [Acer negundo]|uniref:G-patch domain-containing protein n=1 Tax=Acer negundo TaxID=4023 RepID=A0AAD5IKY9_ACENE|nr:hypothetical protein LWI28_008451 [Acer negundo]